MTTLIPLHVKSHCSLGCGTASIRRLVDRASALGLPALGLTDVENLYGQVSFQSLARRRGIRPVTGVELRARWPAAPAGSIPEGRRERLLLLARNREGYENLCRIVTRRRLEGHPEEERRGEEYRSDTHRDLARSVEGLADGLFLLTDSVALIERLIGLSGIDRAALRLLLVRPRGAAPEGPLRSASQHLSVPLVADLDVAFLDPEDYAFHRLLVAVRESCLVSETEKRKLTESPQRYLRSPRACRQLFDDAPETIVESERIAEQCDFDLLRRKPVLSQVELPPGETPYSHLASLCFRGVRQRLGGMRPEVMERLNAELRVIDGLGSCEYFLVVAEIVRFARDRGIEAVGCGSGAASLVAYLLGATNVNPLDHGLCFERFVHPERRALPDIHIDLCRSRRDEVIRHIRETYGTERVAAISSHSTFQPRSALRETLKAFGAPAVEANRCARAIPLPHGPTAPPAPLRDLVASFHATTSPAESLAGTPALGTGLPSGTGRPWGARRPLGIGLSLDEETFRSALALAERLINVPRRLSVHSGAIVITDRPVDSYVPLERAPNGIIMTQYDKDSVEDAGLLKIDLLPNRCLTELEESLEWSRLGGANLKLDDIPDGDPETIELLREGRTVGCFQLESPAMRSLLRKMAPANIRDCVAAVALVRPGAAARGAKECYIRRVNGEESAVCDHPGLREALEENHGAVIYEEDILRVVSAVGGFSLEEGDLLRSALKRCRDEEEVTDLKNRFLRRAVRNDVEPRVARIVWNDLLRFAGGSFSKAHACGYGILAYQSAYLKAHHPVAFACAVLNNHAGMYSARTIAEEIRRMGVRVLHPCVNRSEERFVVEATPAGKSVVRTGLARIKCLSEASRRAILAHRPFRNLLDLIRRSAIPKREIEALILAGALDGVAESGHDSSDRERSGSLTRANHRQLLWELESAYATKRGKGDLRLLPDQSREFARPPLDDDSLEARIRNELATMGMSLSGHPIQLVQEHLDRKTLTTCAEAVHRVGERIRVAGLVAAARKVRTSRGEWMQFVTIEDEHGLLEGALFPKDCRRYEKLLSKPGPFLFEGVVEEDQRDVSLKIQRVRVIDGAPSAERRRQAAPARGRDRRAVRQSLLFAHGWT